jgi:cell division protein FtsQ
MSNDTDVEETVEIDLSDKHDEKDHKEDRKKDRKKDREKDRKQDADKDDEKTVRLARKRFARRQWTRRWLAWRKVVAVVLVLAVLLGAAWLVFFSSVLAVDGVRVTGTRVLSADVVRRAAAVPSGGPLATVNLDAVTARVERLPAVKTVDVSRAWPDKVRIDVTERRAVAVVEPQGGGLARAVDEDGVQFRSFAHAPRGLPAIRIKIGVKADALTEAARVAGALPPSLARKVAFVEVRTVDTISLVLHSGRMVRWGSADGSAEKGRVLAVLLRQKASFYDVSVPGQPIIRK